MTTAARTSSSSSSHHFVASASSPSTSSASLCVGVVVLSISVDRLPAPMRLPRRVVPILRTWFSATPPSSIVNVVSTSGQSHSYCVRLSATASLKNNSNNNNELLPGMWDASYGPFGSGEWVLDAVQIDHVPSGVGVCVTDVSDFDENAPYTDPEIDVLSAQYRAAVWSKASAVVVSLAEAQLRGALQEAFLDVIKNGATKR
eukprot:PhM_4_TR13105/c0_g1_i1/m.83055